MVMPLRQPPDADDKLRDIRSVTDEALSHLGADELLATLLDRVREILDADTAAVLLLSRMHCAERTKRSPASRPDPS